MRLTRPRTLVDLLHVQAGERGQQPAYTFLTDRGAEAGSWTFGELHRRAASIAAHLQSEALAGAPVLLLYPAGLEFIAAFFGCLYAGAIAVPVFPPRRNQFGARLRTIAAEVHASMALTTESVLRSRAETRGRGGAELQGLRWVATDRIETGSEDRWIEPAVSRDTVALLQYTSGSTSAPRGVMLTHANILHNQAVIAEAFEHDERTVVVGWLPVYHDMGLIGNVLQPLYVGGRCVLMSPTAFLIKPYRWLAAITQYRATTSGAPDFAYDLCVRKITAEERATLDLRDWTLAYSGAEPIRPSTLERFSATFAGCGFRPEAFYPCYGLAESTLLVAGGAKARPPVVRETVTRVARGIEQIQPGRTTPGTTSVVGCGWSRFGQKIAVVDPQSRRSCPEGVLGEIWVGGASVAQGYWNRPLETEQTFGCCLSDTGEGPFLRTGDLGFLQDGELFVQGRLKDLIVIRGVNHHPQDFEETVDGCHPDLRPRCGAAFSITVHGEERLAVVQEVERDVRDLDAWAIVAAVRGAVAEAHDLQVYAVSLLRPGSILRTSSGKIQRSACREAFEAGRLDEIASFQLGRQPALRLASHRVPPGLEAARREVCESTGEGSNGTVR